MNTYGQAVEVIPREEVDAKSEEWHSIRRTSITATDACVLSGVPSYGETPFSVYWRKVADIRKPVTKYMNRGTQWEDTLIHIAYQRGGDILEGIWDELVKPGFLTRNVIPDEWMGCTPDALVSVKDTGWCPLEIKTSASWDNWGPELSDEVPLNYKLQVTWQCMVVGAQEGYAACMMPNHEVRVYRIVVDPVDADILKSKAERFLRDHILAEVPPDITGTDAEVTVLKSIFGVNKEKTCVVPTALVDELRHVRALARDYSALAKGVEAQIRMTLADASKGVDQDGNVLITRSRGPRKAYEVAETFVDSLRISPRREGKS